MLLKQLSGWVAMLLVTGGLCAAETQTGPVIKAYGPVYDVPAGSWNLKQNKHYKVSMDVSATADFSGDLNRHLESAAFSHDGACSVAIRRLYSDSLLKGGII